MGKSLVLSTLGFLLLMFLSLPVNSWVYSDNGLADTKFEEFGPRTDKLLIKLYSNETAEFEALKAGEIDITDWPLSKTTYDELTAPPYNDTINVVNYGPDFSLYILDMNSNGNEFLGYPPNPSYRNPSYPNPMSVIGMRRAIAHLINRPSLVADPSISGEFGVPLYSVVSSVYGSYHTGIYGNLTMPWAWEYNRTKAEQLLDASGFAERDAQGWRIWNETGSRVELKFYIRSDHAGRRHIGEALTAEMKAVGLYVHDRFATVNEIFIQVMVNKDFHMYTGGWSLGVDPDHLILWSWTFYWHPGFSYNYGGHNVPEYNEAAEGAMLAETQEEALYWVHRAQQLHAYHVLGVPLYARSWSKAYSRRYVGYVGSEGPYNGRLWEGVVNEVRYGLDNFWSFLNMHPAGYLRGHGEDMTIRWGFKVPDIKQMNPVFASWTYDWNVLSQIYEGLLIRNPSNMAELRPWLAESYEIATYIHPTLGESTKISFALRPEATWQDGTPITTADVYFTYVELDQILRNRGIPPPWWMCNFDDMIDFNILDPYNFELLLDVKSFWEAGWVGSSIVLPKHIWKPIAETGPVGDFAPDPNLIGSGPWRLKEYTANSHVLLMANAPGSPVQTNLAGSIPITSPKGYWRYIPQMIETRIDGGTMAKISHGAVHTVNFTVANLYLNGPTTIEATQTIIYPNGTTSQTTYPNITLNEADQPGSSWTWGHQAVFEGKIRIDLNILVKSPSTLGGWSNVTKYLWATIPEDIAGSHHIDPQLPAPDFRVDIRDVAMAAAAFGTYPGQDGWNPAVDINGDYQIDIRDLALVARKFGWTG